MTMVYSLVGGQIQKIKVDIDSNAFFLLLEMEYCAKICHLGHNYNPDATTR